MDSWKRCWSAVGGAAFFLCRRGSRQSSRNATTSEKLPDSVSEPLLPSAWRRNSRFHERVVSQDKIEANMHRWFGGDTDDCDLQIKEKVKAMFNDCDLDKDGTLTKVELIDGFQANVDVKSFFDAFHEEEGNEQSGIMSIIADTFDKMDTDHDHKVNFDEFWKFAVGDRGFLKRGVHAPAVQRFTSSRGSGRTHQVKITVPLFMCDGAGRVRENVVHVPSLCKKAKGKAHYIHKAEGLAREGDTPLTNVQLETLEDVSTWEHKKLDEYDHEKGRCAHVPIPVWKFDPGTTLAFDSCANGSLYIERVLYLPIFVPRKHTCGGDGMTPPRPNGERWWENIYLPGNLRCLQKCISKCFEIESTLNPRLQDDYYAFLTFDRGFVKEGQSQRVPGWHTDGYQGYERTPKDPVDRTYIGATVPPTLYVDDYHFHLAYLTDDYNMFNAMDAEVGYVMHELLPMESDDPDRYASLVDQHFRDIKPTSSSDMQQHSFPNIVRSAASHLIYFLDSYAVHSPSAPPKDLHRSFLRLQFSAGKYDRAGYTENPLLCGGLPLFNRIDKPYPVFKGACDHPSAQDHPYHKSGIGDFYSVPLYMYYGDVCEPYEMVGTATECPNARKADRHKVAFASLPSLLSK